MDGDDEEHEGEGPGVIEWGGGGRVVEAGDGLTEKGRRWHRRAG